jgi:RimJ/RimL family protein N-acetyltransferase
MSRGPAGFKRIRLGRPWCEAIELTDGRQFILRPMQITDAATLQKSFARLTPEEVHLRFMHPIKELSPAFSRRLASIDRQREFALVLVENLHPDQALIGAVIRAAIDDHGDKAEFAIIVGQEIAGHGLGRHLLGKAIDWARKKRLDSLYGLVLPENHRMLALARSMGFKKVSADQDQDHDLVLVSKSFRR